MEGKVFPRKAELILSDTDGSMDKVIPVSSGVLSFIANRLYDIRKEVDYAECVNGAVDEFDEFYNSINEAIEWLEAVTK